MPAIPLDSTVEFLGKILKQSGVGALFAVVVGFALVRVYDDLQERNKLLVDIVRESVRESRAVADSIRELASEISRFPHPNSRTVNDP